MHGRGEQVCSDVCVMAEVLFIIVSDAPVACFDLTEAAEGQFPCFVTGNESVYL